MIRLHLPGALRVLTLAAILALYAWALRAGAQIPLHPAPAHPAHVEALARICVAEAGWDTATGDCAAIVALLARRAERLGLRPITMARAYSSRHFDARRTDARRWIADLGLRAHEPRGWPSALDWQGRYRPAWLATVAHVEALLRAGGDVAAPCAGLADHWGAPHGADLRRALRAGWQRLDCGPTRNAFWRVPRRGDRA